MMCSGFAFTKNALSALNVLYLLIGIILMSVGGYAKTAGKVSSLSITGGIIAAGVFLFMVAILGILATFRHHQVLLFFYMIILFLIFLIQFFVAIMCLAMNDVQRRSIAEKERCSRSKPCNTCDIEIVRRMDEALRVVGGIGLFFSFTEIIGIWLAFRFRNMKDPRANPNNFL